MILTGVPASCSFVPRADSAHGCRSRRTLAGLGDFVAFMEKRKAKTVTTKLAMEWATLPPDRHASWALRLADVRGFARHVSNLDPRTEVPPVGVLPGWKRAKPYVYSDAQIDALLAAAMDLPPEDGCGDRPAAHCSD